MTLPLEAHLYKPCASAAGVVFQWNDETVVRDMCDACRSLSYLHTFHIEKKEKEERG